MVGKERNGGGSKIQSEAQIERKIRSKKIFNLGEKKTQTVRPMETTQLGH